MLTHNTLDTLRHLKLTGMGDALEQQRAQPETHDLAFEERLALLIGLSCGAAGFALQGLAPDGRWFLSAIPLMALWGLAGPSLQTLMTRQVDPQQQGQLQGAVTSAVSLTGVFGPALFSQLFASMIALGASALIGAPFLLAALLLLLATVLAQRITQPRTALTSAEAQVQ